MKKLFSLILAVMLLALPMLSLAEETTTYTDPAERYSFEYPSDWKVLNKDTIDDILGVAGQLGDDRLAALAQQVKPQLEAVDMVMLMSPSMTSNINAVCQPVGMELGDDMLLAMAPQLVSQMKIQMPGFELVEDASTIELPVGNAMLMQYTYAMAGIDMIGVQAYISKGENLYILTLTTVTDSAEADSEIFGYLLGTLQIL